MRKLSPVAGKFKELPRMCYQISQSTSESENKFNFPDPLESSQLEGLAEIFLNSYLA